MRQHVSADQASLFDAPAPKTRHVAMDPHVFLPAVPHPTQVEAAAAGLPRSGTQRAQVLEAIRGAGEAGMTDQEIAAALSLAENSVRPRRKELEQDRLIVNSGRLRQISIGNRAIVWVVND